MLLAWVHWRNRKQAKQSALYKQALFCFLSFSSNSSTVFTCVRICNCKWNHVKGIKSFCLAWIWGIWSATLQIFVNLLDIQGLWSLNLLDIRSLWSTNHLYICKSQGHSGPMKLKSRVYLQISYLFRALEVRIYWIIANLFDDCKSPGWLEIPWMNANLLDDCKSFEWLQFSQIIANLLNNCKSFEWLQISWIIANLLNDCKSSR